MTPQFIIEADDRCAADILQTIEIWEDPDFDLSLEMEVVFIVLGGTKVDLMAYRQVDYPDLSPVRSLEFPL